MAGMIDRLAAVVAADPQAGMALAVMGLAVYVAVLVATAGMPRGAAQVVRTLVVLVAVLVGAQFAQALVAQELAQAMAPLSQSVAALSSGQLPSQMPDLSWLSSFSGGGIR